MRRPKPFFRKQTGTWYVQLGKKQINLGKDEKAAWEQYDKIMAKRQMGEPQADETVSRVFNRYLAWCKENRSEATFTRNRRHLRRFVIFAGQRLKVSELKRHHIQRWIDEDYAGDSSTYQATAMTAVIGALNWAADLDYVPTNPLRGLKKPPRNVREFFLTREQWQTILAGITDREFQDYFTFAVLTGSRPQETRIIAARHLQDNRIVLSRTESKGKKRQRVIFLPQQAREIVERLARRHPEGPLFRNRDGNPWTKDAINCRFQRLKTKHNMPELCAYTLRHTFAHEKLSEGIDSHLVSKLLGHTDGRMLESRYGHIEQNSDVMLKAVEGNRQAAPIVDLQHGSAADMSVDHPA